MEKRKSNHNNKNHNNHHKRQPKKKHKKFQIFVGLIPNDTKSAHLLKYFSKFGEVSKISLKSKSRTKDRDTAVLEVLNFRTMEAILNHPKHIFHGDVLLVDCFRTPEEIDRQKKSSIRRRVYVCNIPHDMLNEDFHEAFKPLGGIEKAIVYKRSCIHDPMENYGFVTFRTKKEAENALEVGHVDAGDGIRLIIRPFKMNPIKINKGILDRILKPKGPSKRGSGRKRSNKSLKSRNFAGDEAGDIDDDYASEDRFRGYEVDRSGHMGYDYDHNYTRGHQDEKRKGRKGRQQRNTNFKKKAYDGGFGSPGRRRGFPEEGYEDNERWDEPEGYYSKKSFQRNQPHKRSRNQPSSSNRRRNEQFYGSSGKKSSKNRQRRRREDESAASYNRPRDYYRDDVNSDQEYDHRDYHNQGSGGGGYRGPKNRPKKSNNNYKGKKGGSRQERYQGSAQGHSSQNQRRGDRQSAPYGFTEDFGSEEEEGWETPSIPFNRQNEQGYADYEGAGYSREPDFYNKGFRGRKRENQIHDQNDRKGQKLGSLEIREKESPHQEEEFECPEGQGKGLRPPDSNRSSGGYSDPQPSFAGPSRDHLGHQASQQASKSSKNQINFENSNKNSHQDLDEKDSNNAIPEKSNPIQAEIGQNQRQITKIKTQYGEITFDRNRRAQGPENLLYQNLGLWNVQNQPQINNFGSNNIHKEICFGSQGEVNEVKNSPKDHFLSSSAEEIHSFKTKRNNSYAHPQSEPNLAKNQSTQHLSKNSDKINQEAQQGALTSYMGPKQQGRRAQLREQLHPNFINNAYNYHPLDPQGGGQPSHHVQYHHVVPNNNINNQHKAYVENAFNKGSTLQAVQGGQNMLKISQKDTNNNDNNNMNPNIEKKIDPTKHLNQAKWSETDPHNNINSAKNDTNININSNNNNNQYWLYEIDQDKINTTSHNQNISIDQHSPSLNYPRRGQNQGPHDLNNNKNSNINYENREGQLDVNHPSKKALYAPMIPQEGSEGPVRQNSSFESEEQKITKKNNFEQKQQLSPLKADQEPQGKGHNPKNIPPARIGRHNFQPRAFSKIDEELLTRLTSALKDPNLLYLIAKNHLVVGNLRFNLLKNRKMSNNDAKNPQ